MGGFSILVLTSDIAFREQVCGEMVRGLRCQIFTASEASAALALIRAENPTLVLLTPEFARVHEKPIADIVAELSPKTLVAFLPPPPLAASSQGSN